jgi:hypothetical protein
VLRPALKVVAAERALGIPNQARRQKLSPDGLIAARSTGGIVPDANSAVEEEARV